MTLTALAVRTRGEFIFLQKSTYQTGEMRTFIIEQCILTTWSFAAEIEARSAGDAAVEWIATRPKHTFRILEK